MASSQFVAIETAPIIAAQALRGEVMLYVTNPESGVRYSYALRRDIFAKPPTLFGGGIDPNPRLTFIMRRADGEVIPGSWNSTRASVERDIYGAEDLGRQLAATIEAGGTVEAGPCFGPWQPTNNDWLHCWERHADHFRDTYRTAWQARDWPTVREACRAFRDEFPAWMRERLTGDIRSSSTVIARNMRGEPHPPRWQIASRSGGGRSNRVQGFAAYVKIERATLDGLTALHDLPGFDFADPRTAIPVILRWTGQVRHVAKAELHAPLSQFLHPVKPNGSPMPRARAFQRSEVTNIKAAGSRQRAAV
jgi:hypothetical protein